jgi:hypothetical protein
MERVTKYQDDSGKCHDTENECKIADAIIYLEIHFRQATAHNETNFKEFLASVLKDTKAVRAIELLDSNPGIAQTQLRGWPIF